MDGLDLADAVWFAGDLDDPWVVAIAGALPRHSLRLHCPDDLPETWPIDRPTPSALVLHRSFLTPTDAQRVARLKARADGTPRVVLCLGSQARYLEVERWSRLVDVILPEATASETVLRQALAIDRPLRADLAPGPRIVVVSSSFEIRSAIGEMAQAGGFSVELRSDPLDVETAPAIVWDVPVLEADWSTRLAWLSKAGPVVALLGFADRSTVNLARKHGSSACLDLPCDVGDLLAMLDRVVSTRRDAPHPIPPAPFLKKARESVY